ncbi:MAG: MFS transporter [Acidimicrobiales bacterium]|nr:MFS transporter [Acidimicrobiales bacterium]
MATVDELLDEAPLTRLHIRVWLVAALGVMLDGFDFFVVGVCLPLIARDLDTTTLQQGLIASAAVAGSVVGALVAGPLSDRLGRRLLFTVDLIMFVVFALASAFAWDAWSLIAFRFLLGVAIGADYPLSSSYAAEIAPRRHRNRMLVGVISFQAVGSLIGVALGLVVVNATESVSAWRWIFGAGAVLAGAIVVARIGVPESPRWLFDQGSRPEALRVVSRFLGRTVTSAGVANAADAAPRPEREPAGWRTLFTETFRRRTALTSVPWFLMDIVVYGIGVFTPTILAAIIVTDTDSFIGHEISSLRGTAFADLFLVAGFVGALVLINRVGFIRLQVTGFLAMTVGLGMLALAAGLPGGADDYFLLAFAGFAISNFFQNLGPNSTTFLMPAVVFPTRIRATGAGFGAAAGKAGAVVVTLLFPVLQGWIGLSATVGLMAAGSLAAAIVTLTLRSSASTAALSRAG